MRYEFSATLEDAICHIRAARCHFLPQERVDDRPHKHYSMEFHCVFEGAESISLPQENRKIILSPGQILLIPKEIYHGVKTEGGTVERICFHFTTEARRGKNDPISRPFQGICSPLIFEDDRAKQIMELCRLIQMQEDNPLNRARQGMLMISAALHLLDRTTGADHVSKSVPTREIEKKWVIQDYLERRFTDPRGLEGLAAELYLSQRQTGTLVKKYMGESFKSIIIRRRMELAEIFLQDESRTLEDIAWQVGYHSYSGFQLSFKEHFGMTPSQKRKELFSGSKGNGDAVPP